MFVAYLNAQKNSSNKTLFEELSEEEFLPRFRQLIS